MTHDGNRPCGLVFLRPLESNDLSRIHKWHNDHELYSHFSGSHRFVSMTVVEQWLRTNMEYSNESVSFAICIAENHEHIGNIYLRAIEWVARHAEVAMFIADPTHRSKGYGQTALRLMIRHAFDDLGLMRLHLRTLYDNQYAVRIYEKCGFRIEGRLHRHAYKDGQFKDVLIMGLCVESLHDPASSGASCGRNS